MPKTLNTKKTIPGLRFHPGSQARRVVAVVSGKGGVGKSTATAILGATLQAMGQRVGILDADITGPSIPSMFGVLEERAVGTNQQIEPIITKTGLKLMSLNVLIGEKDTPVIWRSPIINNMLKEFYSSVNWGELDTLLIDMPPGTGDTVLSVFQQFNLDGVVVISTPQEVVDLIVRKSVRMAEKMNIPILGLIENMSYFIAPDTRLIYEIFGPSRVESSAEKLKTTVIARLPIDPELSRANDHGQIEDYIEAHPLILRKDLELFYE